MRILSVTAQKPDSTGSGIYLTELVRKFKKMGGGKIETGIANIFYLIISYFKTII